MKFNNNKILKCKLLINRLETSLHFRSNVRTFKICLLFFGCAEQAQAKTDAHAHPHIRPTDRKFSGQCTLTCGCAGSVFLSPKFVGGKRFGSNIVGQE